MSTPVAGAPTATPPTPDAAPAAPQSLSEIQRGVKGLRAKQVQGPQGGFVKMKGGPVRPAPVAPPMDAKPATAAAKAGAPDAPPAPEAPEAPPAAPEPAKVDPLAELKKGFDAKSRELADYKKRVSEYEDMGKKDFRSLVTKLAAEFGADPTEVAQALLLEKAHRWQEEQDLAAMSPEERELHQLRKERDERVALEATAAEEKAAAAREAVGRASYDATTAKMIEAHKLLPESVRTHPEFNGRAAERIRDRFLALASVADPNMPAQEFLATIDPAKLAADAWADHRAELRLALLAADDAGLDDLLTPEVAARWTKKLQGQAVARAHPALTAQPRAGDGKFVKGEDKPAPKPLSAMKPSWGAFLPKRRG